MIREPKRLDLSLYISREPVILAVLTGLAVVLFLAVTGLARLHDAQQQSLAVEWSTRGLDDLNAGRYAVAIPEFHTALEYARDNDDYRLELAEALVGLNRPDEAYAYLINVRDRQPDNGVVNLELARIAVGRKQTEQALRFYHNAINATWSENHEMERRKAQLELFDYLLRINRRTEAEAVLIALGANVGEDAAEQEHLGELMLRVQDNTRALAAFRESLKLTPKNAAAEAGAGTAAFNLGMYSAAEHYLNEAVEAASGDASSVARLKTTDAVLRLDPYRPRIREEERGRTVLAAFAASGDRLRACGALGEPKTPTAEETQAETSKSTPPTTMDGLAGKWTKLKPQVTARGLRENPDLVNTVMNLASQIESQKEPQCGAATEDDKALMLIANLHEEN